MSLSIAWWEGKKYRKNDGVILGSIVCTFDPNLRMKFVLQHAWEEKGKCYNLPRYIKTVSDMV